jgi:hypothetical protein
MAALAVLHTWPLARDYSGHLAGGLADPYITSWQFWWMKQALVTQPQNPWFTPLLHHPLGADLYWHTLMPGKTILGVVIPLFSPEELYNLSILASFALTGWTTWLLFRWLLEKAGQPAARAAAAAFAGAVAFDFCRYHLAHAHAHLNLVALEGLPLYLLFFLRWLDDGRRRWLLLLALAALYTASCDFYYLAYEAIFSAAWLIADRWRRGPLLSLASLGDPALSRGAWAALAALLACSPLLLMLARHANPEPFCYFHKDADYFTDLAGFFFPDRLSYWYQHGWLSPAARAVVARLPGNLEEGGYWLGWATPACALWALLKGIPDGRRWLGIAAVLALCSFGVNLSVAGEIELSPSIPLGLITVALVGLRWSGFRVRRDVIAALAIATLYFTLVPAQANDLPFTVRVPMPYLLMKELPFLSRGGMPNRLALFLELAIGVFFAFAAARLAERLAGRGRAVALSAAVAMAAIPSFEFRDGTMLMAPLEPVPALFEEIRRAPPEWAVFVDANELSEFDQIRHGHPISYAYLSRVPRPNVDLIESRLYRILMRGTGLEEPFRPGELEEMRKFLQDHKFKWYVAHALEPRRRAFVQGELGGELVQDDGRHVAYVFNWVR